MVKWIGRVFAALLVLGLGLYALYSYYAPRVELRYRLTIEVEVDGQRRSGSGVIGAVYWRMPIALGGQGGGMWHSGEAVAVDLGPKGRLYALLIGRTRQGLPGQPEPASMLFGVYLNHMSGKGPLMEIYRQLEALKSDRSVREVPLKWVPYLVRFRDPKDARTI